MIKDYYKQKLLPQNTPKTREKRYSRTTLTNFTETLEAFLTCVSYKFFCWLKENEEIFAQYKAIVITIKFRTV
ncbi:MAG: hypothetical protein MGG11_12495 [Trichodesmium sp. MAG_R03]|nr:hypothetical protein [Trichodesmium sp. MAG_R03]